MFAEVVFKFEDKEDEGGGEDDEDGSVAAERISGEGASRRTVAG